MSIDIIFKNSEEMKVGYVFSQGILSNNYFHSGRFTSKDPIV